MAYYPLTLSFSLWDNFLLFQRKLRRFYNDLRFYSVSRQNRFSKERFRVLIVRNLSEFLFLLQLNRSVEALYQRAKRKEEK
jgi:hypothetical protein